MSTDTTPAPVPADEPMHLFVGFRETGGEAFLGVKRTLDDAKALVEDSDEAVGYFGDAMVWGEPRINNGVREWVGQIVTDPYAGGATLFSVREIVL
jgi:hypothetical protein